MQISNLYVRTVEKKKKRRRKEEKERTHFSLPSKMEGACALLRASIVHHLFYYMYFTEQQMKPTACRIMPWRKKTQRRVQLTATDLWGRTALTHSISSGREQLFDAVLRAVRQDVLDSEVKLLPYVVQRMFWC